MIKTKKELTFYIEEDKKRFESDYPKSPKLKDWILRNEWVYIYRYIKLLRLVEYNLNRNNRFLYLIYFIQFKRLGYKLRFTIYPNTVGPGFRIYHTGGFTHIKKNTQIGCNFSALPGLVIGNKHFPNIDNEKVIIGDNVSIGLNVIILGNVYIGNNVVIGANSVITKDIPDNSIVCGNPAKVLKSNLK